MQKNGAERIADFMGDVRREPPEPRKRRRLLHLLLQAQARGPFAVPGRRAGLDPPGERGLGAPDLPGGGGKLGQRLDEPRVFPIKLPALIMRDHPDRPDRLPLDLKREQQGFHHGRDGGQRREKTLRHVHQLRGVSVDRGPARAGVPGHGIIQAIGKDAREGFPPEHRLSILGLEEAESRRIGPAQGERGLHQPLQDVGRMRGHFMGQVHQGAVFGRIIRRAGGPLRQLRRDVDLFEGYCATHGTRVMRHTLHLLPSASPGLAALLSSRGGAWEVYTSRASYKRVGVVHKPWDSAHFR